MAEAILRFAPAPLATPPSRERLILRIKLPAAATRERCVLRVRIPPAWTTEEAARLQRLAGEHGFRRWRRVARQMPGRSARQCRGRWRDHLARDVYHRPFTARDDEELAHLHLRLGGAGGRRHWKDVARAVHGRSSRAMKRRWRELRESDAFLGKLWRPLPPAPPLPSGDMESELESESSAGMLALQQKPCANVLAWSFSSCGSALASVCLAA